jgi:hypothetical protein
LWNFMTAERSEACHRIVQSRDYLRNIKSL